MRLETILTYKRLHVRGMAMWPFIFIGDQRFKEDRVLLNHERIHHQQQLELLIFPFYILYFLNYLFNRLKYKDHDRAYREIVFEREAYENEANLDYIGKRKVYGWTKYLSFPSNI